ncbi:MAG TPA: hypothetical protein VGE40_09565, partial [Bacilli bacterium]
MNYRSMAPHINTSCYNCLFFEVSADMLNGTCHLSEQENGKSAIGVGTCDGFTKKLHAEFNWT